MTRVPFAVLASAILSIAACSSASDKKADSSKSAGAGTVSGADLTGAGATFPYPLYSRWVSEYAAATGVKINYQQIGSGGGVKQLQEQTVDFGASDAPMSDSEMVKAKGGPVFHIPTVVGIVAIAYNLPQVTQPLKLSGPIVADIFLGKITKWNDSRIVSLNPGIALPNNASIGLHEAMGFRKVGVYEKVGWKFGQWHDVAWFGRPLGPEDGEPSRPLTVEEARALPGWNEALAWSSR